MGERGAGDSGGSGACWLVAIALAACGGATASSRDLEGGAGVVGDGGEGAESGAPEEDAGVFACGSELCGYGEECDIPRELDGGLDLANAGCQPLAGPACEPNPSCACLVPGATAPPCICSDDGRGHVTVECLPGG